MQVLFTVLFFVVKISIKFCLRCSIGCEDNGFMAVNDTFLSKGNFISPFTDKIKPELN